MNLYPNNKRLSGIFVCDSGSRKQGKTLWENGFEINLKWKMLKVTLMVLMQRESLYFVDAGGNQ